MRLDSITRHNDATLAQQSEGVVLTLTLQVNQVAARCDGYARALFVPIRTGVDVHFDGLRVTAQVMVNAQQQSVQVQNTQISERWGFKIRTNKVLQVFANLLKSRIERAILNVINAQLKKQLEKKRNVDLSKFITG